MERAADGVSIEGRKANRWRKQNPAKTLDTLYEAGGKRIVAIKVFSNHLGRDTLRSEILARDDIGFAVLRRRPIECFISGMKANSLDKFARVDTTDIKPTLDADHFLEWAAAMRDWYVWVNAQLKARNAPFAKISYENHLRGRTGREALTEIFQLLKPLNFPDIPVPNQIRDRPQQDREPDFQNRVANWDEFLAATQQDPDNARLLEWALKVR